MYSEEPQDLHQTNARGICPMRTDAKWPTLSDRRTFLSLIECYKIVFGFYHLKFEDFFYFAFSILNLNLNCISIFNCIDLDFYFIFIYLFILF